MELKANVNFDRFEGALQVVDSHTVGEFCRIVIGGFPEPQGNTMIEKKKWMEENYDHVRTALMFEPRGHHDMFGAFLCEPVDKTADFGVMFMDTGGYLNMCGHCTIGAVTVAVEAGLVESKEGENEVILEAPAGLIRTKAIVKGGKVESVTLTNVPSFVYKENQKITVDGREIEFTISFGGSFFALVDTTKLDIGEINPKTVPEYTKLGMKMLEIINKEIPVKHPLLDITEVDLVEFYGPTPNPGKATMRNVVIFGDAMADRSPCGTGTSAKLATLHHWGEIKVGEEFIYESFIGSLFKGVIKETTKVEDFDAVVPMITGSCYLTGVATYLIDPEDPLKYGFRDVIYKNPDGIRMPEGDTVHTLYVEMKNKHNTMNSASSAKTYIKMQGQILEDDDCACLLVEAIAKKSQNIKWTTKVDGKNVQHRLIRRVSMDQFYAVLTGEEDAFYKLCMALPGIIDSVVNEEGGGMVPRDTVIQELEKVAAMYAGQPKDLAMAMAVYMLGFHTYMGFGNGVGQQLGGGNDGILKRIYEYAKKSD